MDHIEAVVVGYILILMVFCGVAVWWEERSRRTLTDLPPQTIHQNLQLLSPSCNLPPQTIHQNLQHLPLARNLPPQTIHQNLQRLPPARNLPPQTIHQNLQRLPPAPNLPPQTFNQNLQPQQDIETGQIKVLMFKDMKYNEEEEGTDKRSCPICLEEYHDDHEIRRLNNCGHVFHPFCIFSWLKLNRTCPICRSPV